MSFWDRLLGKDGQGPLGGVWTAAQHTKDAFEAGNYLGALGGVVEGTLATGGAGLVANAAGTDLPTAFSKPYQYGVARPLTSYNYATQGLTWGRLLDAEQWDRMTDADTWAEGWDVSKTVSPGQSTLISGEAIPQGRGIGFGQDEKSVEARKKYFEDTWSGKLSSGSIDFILNVGADPLNLAGVPAGKALQGARYTIKPSERAAVLAAAKGAEPTTNAVARKANSIKGFITYTDNVGSAAEIALHPALRNNPEGGTIAYFIDRANKSFPGITKEAVEARNAAKMDLIGSMLGDGDAVFKLNSRNFELADELKRISSPPPQSRFVEEYTFDKQGQGSFLSANSGIVPEVEAQRDAIMSEISRLDRVIEAAGASNRIAPNVAEGQILGQQLRGLNDTGLRSSVLRGGIGQRPIVVLAGQLGKRLDGHVSLRDPVTGFEQLRETLKQAPYMKGAQQKELLDLWVKAASDTDRAMVVRRAEAAIVTTTAQKYGLSDDAAREIIKAGEGTRRNVVTHMQERLYSADKDAWIHTVDPESDRIIVRSRPLAQSQVEDFHPVIDPRALDSLFRAGTHNRLFETLGAKAGVKGLATSAYEKTDPLIGLAQTGLMNFTKLWKDATLLPRFVAYGIRIQTDSQARLASHMGALAYMGAAKESFKDYGVLLKNSKIFGTPDYEKAIGPALIKMGIDEADVPQIVRNIQSTNGGMADLANEVAQHQLQKFRATGSWEKVKPDAPEWQAAYDQAILQVKNSPVMMAVVNGMGDDALKQFLVKDPRGRAEWLNLRKSWDDDVDQYIGAVKAHVDHMVPDATTKAYALGQKTPDEMAEYFKTVGQNRRMDVHGQSYSPVERNKLAEWYNNGREYLYRLASEAPETVLARAPIYMYEYDRALKRIMANVSANGEKLYPDAMLNARKQADRIARREVGKTLFDASHTSNLASTFRFVSPFFSAWEDMMTKWGRLFYNNPGTAQRFVQAWNIPADVGVLHDEHGNRVDSEGNYFDAVTGRKLDPKADAALIGDRKMVVVPLGFVPKSIRDKIGVQAIGFDQNSFNVVFQGEPAWLPGTGPLVSIPANSFVRSAFPEAETNPVMQYLLPYGANNDSIPTQILPSWAKNLKKSGVGPFGTEDDFRAQAGIFMKQEEIRFQQEQRESRPTMEEISSKTRNWFLIRTFSSLTSPLATQPQTELQFYIDQGRIYRQLYGNSQSSPEYKATLAEYEKQYSGGDYPKGFARDKMLSEHPEFESWESRFQRDFPEYFDAAISVSTNETGMVANIATTRKIREYRKEIAASPEFAWAIAGPDNAYGLDPEHEFSNAAYQYQLTQSVKPGSKEKFRTVKDADVALADAEAQKGWVEYQKARTMINLAMASSGVTSLSESRAKPLADAWKSYQRQLAGRNQSWAREFGKRDTAKAMDFMRSMQSAMAGNQKLAKEPQMVALTKYVRARNMMVQVLKTSGAGLNAQQNEPLARAWGSYVQSLLADSPGFEQVYNRVLEQDDLSVEVPSGG